MQVIKVQFRKIGDEVLAVFPYEIEGQTSVSCYAHIGQHSACSNMINCWSKRAKKEEYQSLLNELLQIYSDTMLIVIKRRSHDEYLKAYYNAKT